MSGPFVRWLLLLLVLASGTASTGQNSVKFDQSKPFEILNLASSADYPSSDPDTTYCDDWRLGKEEVHGIVKALKPLTGPEWHYLFGHYPCQYTAVLSQDGNRFRLAINAGAWLTITSMDTTTYYGDLEGVAEDLFIDSVWTEEGER